MEKGRSLKALLSTERAKGILTIILYIVMLGIGPLIAALLLKTYRSITGFFDEELFNNLLVSINLIIALIVFTSVFFKTLKTDAKEADKEKCLPDPHNGANNTGFELRKH